MSDYLKPFLLQPRTLTAIAKKLKIDRQEARQLVDRLIAEGFVVKRGMRDFREKPKYELTQSGRES